LAAARDPGEIALPGADLGELHVEDEPPYVLAGPRRDDLGSEIDAGALAVDPQAAQPTRRGAVLERLEQRSTPAGAGPEGATDGEDPERLERAEAVAREQLARERRARVGHRPEVRERL